MRLDATTRRPASSSILVIAPVRLRRVASGLMIEKVRVTAMAERSPEISGWDRRRAYLSAFAAASPYRYWKRRDCGAFMCRDRPTGRQDAAIPPLLHQPTYK